MTVDSYTIEPMNPISTALVGVILLHAAVAETHPAMIEPTILIRSNLLVMFLFAYSLS